MFNSKGGLEFWSKCHLDRKKQRGERNLLVERKWLLGKMTGLFEEKIVDMIVCGNVCVWCPLLVLSPELRVSSLLKSQRGDLGHLSFFWRIYL